jgi:hypothetical protein
MYAIFVMKLAAPSSKENALLALADFFSADFSNSRRFWTLVVDLAWS